MRNTSPTIDTNDFNATYQALRKLLSFSIASCFITILLAARPISSTSLATAFTAAFSGEAESIRAFKTARELSQAKRTHSEQQIQYVINIIKKSKKNDADARKLAEVIVRASKVASYDPLFVASVIRSESTFNKHAVSPVGATGLMQILPGTGEYISKRSKLEWHGEGKLVDPEYNLALGIAYLKDLEKKFKGNREHALIAYNWGPGNLYKAFKGTKTIPTSSMDYAKGVISRHSKWTKEFGTRTIASNTLRVVG